MGITNWYYWVMFRVWMRQFLWVMFAVCLLHFNLKASNRGHECHATCPDILLWHAKYVSTVKWAEKPKKEGLDSVYYGEDIMHGVSHGYCLGLMVCIRWVTIPWLSKYILTVLSNRKIRGDVQVMLEEVEGYIQTVGLSHPCHLVGGVFITPKSEL